MRTGAACLVMAIWVAAACAAPSESAGPPAPPDVAFTPVALPDGAVPEVLAADGDQLLVGIHREGAPQPPGLVRRGPDGTVTEIPAQAATGYGRTASWYSLAADGTRILAIGGDRGGAHGNVRWSVWTGSATGVAEHAQAFSTFGGWGAGDLIDAVLVPGGAPSSARGRATTPVSTWPCGPRRATPGCGVPRPAPRCRPARRGGVRDRGDRVRARAWWWRAGRSPRDGHGQAPVVWQSGPDAAGLEQDRAARRGQGGHLDGDPVRGHHVRGDGKGGRQPGAVAPRRRPVEPRHRPPPIAVGDSDRLAAPLDIDGSLTEIVADQGQVAVVEVGETTSTRKAAGPTGPVTAAVRVGPTVFVVAGDRLWQADAATLH